jgi:hypothetical protein
MSASSTLSAVLFVIIIAGLVMSCGRTDFLTGGKTPEKTSLNKDTDDDTGPDPDPDTDTESEADFEIDFDCLSHGEWVWQQLQDGVECGTGCRQLTFADMYEISEREWDVSDRYLAFAQARHSSNGMYDGTELRIIDLEQFLELVVPAHVPEYSGLHVSIHKPAIVGEDVYFGVYTFEPTDRYRALVRLDLEQQCQQMIYKQEFVNVDWDEPHLLSFREIHASERLLVMRSNVTAEGPYTVVGFDLENPAAGLWAPFDEYMPYEMHAYGTVAAWTTWFYGSIFLYDLATDEEVLIDQSEDGHSCPRIWETRLVYVNLPKQGSGSDVSLWQHADILMYDWESDESVQITDEEWSQGYPDIEGDDVVWLDCRLCSDPFSNPENCCWDNQVYHRDLVTWVETQVTDIPDKRKYNPRVAGGRVFFETHLPEYSILMVDLSQL